MNHFKKRKPLEVAKLFIRKYFPHCDAALLAGSVVRGEATETSDLDIVIFDSMLPRSYRESFLFEGWPIEAFVHNFKSYRYFFQKDYERARPSHQQMIAESLVIIANPLIPSIKYEAIQQLNKGPEPWKVDIIDKKRYFLTDILDDFIGSNDRGEELFTANQLANLVHEFVLRTNRQWLGESKWIIRALRNFDKQFSEEFVEAFDLFYKHGEKERVIKLVDHILRPYGGRLFDGYNTRK